VVAVSADTRALKRLRVAMKVLDKESKRAVNKTLRASLEPIREEFRSEVDQVVPESGGLRKLVKRSRFVVVKRLGGSRPTLSIRIRKGQRGHLAIMNEGRLRHPVHGRPGLTRKEWRWVDQTIRAGMWDRTLDKAVPGVADALRESVQEALEATVRAAERG
jgi:hypothetical protein